MEEPTAADGPGNPVTAGPGTGEAGPGPAATAPHAPWPSPFRRLGAGFMRLDARRLANFKVEDMALAGGYFLLFWLLDAVNLTAFGSLRVEALASAWPAVAVLGCAGVLFRRAAPAAMAWMCGPAAVGLLLAGHAGSFILMFEFFFSLVLFGTARASAFASRTSWWLTALLVAAALAASRDAGLTVLAGLLGVITFLTPVEWAGNLRKATLLAESESSRADAVHEAAAQRLLAERNAHDLALEQERQHMARELHDVISARLSAIALQSGAALHAADAGPGTTLLRQIRQESVAGLDELNAMIRLLHSGAASQAPGRIAELESLIGRHRGAGLELGFSNALPDGGRHLPLPVQTTVYRVAAESLANAARHAAGRPVDMWLAEVRQGDAGATAGRQEAQPPAPPRTPAPAAGAEPATELVLSVSSTLPCRTPAPSPGTGTGIPSMQFRAAHAGGTLTAGPESGRWKVLLRLPLPGPAPSPSDQAPPPAATAATQKGLPT